MTGPLDKILQLLGHCPGFVITGPIGSGKTQTANAVAEGLRAQDVSVGGVVSPRVLEYGLTTGYMVRDLLTGEERRLCTESPPGIRFRRFYFSPTALEFANAAVARAGREAEAVVVDEVGPLELSGGGTAGGVQEVLHGRAFLIMCVRPWLVEEACLWAGLPKTAPIWEVPAG
ncbi:MAG: nucleoside-triphosphatase [Candidatus Bipolaricaulota bacterium]